MANSHGDSLLRYDFPPDHYPITIEALHCDTREVVWSTVIKRPRDTQLVHIPPLKKILGHPILIRIRFANGEVQEAVPTYPGSPDNPDTCP